MVEAVCLQVEYGWVFQLKVCYVQVLVLLGLSSENRSSNVKPGVHYQNFCDHSRNFALVNSKF